MSPLRQSRFSLNQLLGYVFIGILLLGAIWYIAWQARLLISGPQISLDQELAVVQDQRYVTLTGTAKNITAITLNGRPIVTDEYGAFNEQVILENGYSKVQITASDRYGRQTAVERTFVYTPDQIN